MLETSSLKLRTFYRQPGARVSLELLLSCVLIIVLGVFAIKPTLTTMAQLVKEIEEKEALNEQLEKKIAALTTAQKEFTAVQDRLYLLDESIPSEPEVVRVVKTLERTATDSKVLISSISLARLPDDHAEAELPFSQMKQQVLPMSVQLTGDYVAIRSFVENLLSNRRTFTITSVAFSVGERRDEGERLTATIGLDVPYYGPAKAAKKTSNEKN